MTMTDHDLALAHHQRAAHLADWLRDLLAAIDDHAEDVPRAVHHVAGYARAALNAPLCPDEGHDIRLVPSDPDRTHAVRDEWRTECSCGWAGPPDAGQGPACEHWLRHMREVASS